jgi:alanine dehydrogenase
MNSPPGRASGAPVWLGEDDVVAAVSLPAVIAAVRGAYLRLAAGEIVPMRKTLATWDGGTLHAIGAVAPGGGLAVAKTWAHTSGGATPLLLAWDVAAGRLIAVIEAFALGQLRTSAVCGVATDALAAGQCDVVGVVGSGRQAEGQIAAIAAVRKVHEVRIYSPTREHRTAFAARIAERSGITTSAAASARAALAGAAVVVTVTRAREPVVSRAMVADGAHINAVGAISPERAELEPAVVRAARRVVADDVAAARDLASREFGYANAPHVLSLAGVLAGSIGRPDNKDALTVFKSVGSGVSDLAVAELVLAHAQARGLGRPLTLSARAIPRMWREQ